MKVNCRLYVYLYERERERNYVETRPKFGNESGRFFRCRLGEFAGFLEVVE